MNTKVCLIGPSSERYKGGIAQFTRALADNLARNRETLFVSWYQLYPPFLLSRDFIDRVSEKKIGKEQAEFLLGYLNPFSWLKTAKRIAQFETTHLFLTWIHPVHAPVYIFLIALVRLFSKPRITFICHNVLPHESFFASRILSKICLGLADDLIVHGQSECETAKSLGIQNVEKLFLPLHDFFPHRVDTGEQSDRTE